MAFDNINRQVINLLFLFFLSFVLIGWNDISFGSSESKANKTSNNKIKKVEAQAVSVVNETLGNGVQNIYITGIAGSKVIYTDFGGADIYTILPTMAGDIEIRDNQYSTINLPAGLTISAAQFLSNGLQFTINSFTLTLLGKPDMFSFVFAGSPLNSGSGVSKTLAQTAQTFGTTTPAPGQPINQATITGTVQNDGSLKSLNTDIITPSVPTNVVATPLSPHSIYLTWSPSIDNIAVDGYKIYKDGILKVIVTSVTNWTDTNLNSSVKYCYSISSIDTANNESAQCEVKCATTLFSIIDNLPPDPGVAATATTKGIDSNNNGVRDEVEIVLAKIAINNTEYNKTFIIAKEYQKILNEDAPELDKIIRTVACTQMLNNSDILNSNELFYLIFDTPERRAIYNSFDEKKGMSIGDTDQINCE